MLAYEVVCDTCGWSQTYTSQARANYHSGRHSCAKQLAVAAARERGEKRRQAVDRTPKPCHHKYANHQHGEYACYVLDHCRCVPCSKANAEYEANRTRQRAYGRWDNLVDAEPAREHVRELMEGGMGWKQIAARSGVSSGSLTRLVWGKQGGEPSRRIRRETEARLLTVELELAGGINVSNLGAVRRLRALVTLGYSMAYLARRLDMLPGNFGRLIHREGLSRASTVHAVAELYEELSMALPPEETKEQRGSASRARGYAKKHRWLPPLAWDDDEIDDPDYEPVRPMKEASKLHDDQIDESAIYRRMHGDKSVKLSKLEAAEVVARCHAARWTWEQIEKRTGLKPDRYPNNEDAGLQELHAQGGAT